MNIDSKFIFYISFSDNPEALINAVFLNNGAYFGLRGRQDHVNMTWGWYTAEKYFWWKGVSGI